MPTFTYRHRVRYRECDPMGVVYHGHYLDYFEYARTEALRNAGLPYKELEASGVIMPVVDLRLKFHSPARYDDVLAIATSVPDDVPGVRLTFTYEAHIVPDGRLAATGEVTLCFVDAASGRPRRAPDIVADLFRGYST